MADNPPTGVSDYINGQRNGSTRSLWFSQQIGEQAIPTLADAENLLVPGVAADLAQWQSDMAQRGHPVDPNVELRFTEQFGQVTTTSFVEPRVEMRNGIVNVVTLPEDYRRWGPEDARNHLSSREDLRLQGYRPFAGPAEQLNLISSIASRAGLGMVTIYQGSAAQLHSVAVAGMMRDGTPYMVVDPVLFQRNPDFAMGIIAHEMGHIAQNAGNLEQTLDLAVANHNDRTHTVARLLETDADRFAVRIGEGQHLAQALQVLSHGRDNPHDVTHPPVSQRIANITREIAAQKLPVQEASHGNKTPPQPIGNDMTDVSLRR